MSTPSPRGRARPLILGLAALSCSCAAATLEESVRPTDDTVRAEATQADQAVPVAPVFAPVPGWAPSGPLPAGAVPSAAPAGRSTFSRDGAPCVTTDAADPAAPSPIEWAERCSAP